jgi:hypothetical protein
LPRRASHVASPVTGLDTATYVIVVTCAIVVTCVYSSESDLFWALCSISVPARRVGVVTWKWPMNDTLLLSYGSQWDDLWLRVAGIRDP